MFHRVASIAVRSSTCSRLAVPIVILLLGRSLAPVAAETGDLDPGFGDEGVVHLGVDGLYGANAVVIQDDGKIVAGGSHYDAGGDEDLALVRLEPDGEVDEEFGDDGLVITDISDGEEEITSLILQPDGKILAAGYTGLGDWGFVLARYNQDGDLDENFGDDGVVTTAFDHGTFANALSLGPDGSVVVVGTQSIEADQENPLPTRSVVARYDEDGEPDGDFGNQGIVLNDLGPSVSAEANGVAVYPDGTILVAGRISIRTEGEGEDGGSAPSDSTNVFFALQRYDAEGNVDPTYGSTGENRWEDFVLAGFAEALNVSVNAMVVQPDGSVLLGGGIGFDNYLVGDFALARFTAEGVLDDSFGEDGTVHTDFGDEYVAIEALALLPDGEIVAVGDFADEFALAFYDEEGELDEDIGDDGLILESVPGTANAVAVDEDGNVLVVGTTGSLSNERGVIVRYEA